MADLKPCPFCGGEAGTSSERFERTLLAWVYCTGCGAAGGYRHTGAEAVEAWNTRAERTCRMEWDDEADSDELYPVGHVTCSACGAWLYSVNEMRFCPSCGAKVVGE